MSEFFTKIKDGVYTKGTGSLKSLQKEMSSKQVLLTPPPTEVADVGADGHNLRRTPASYPKVAKLVPFLRKVQQLCEGAPPHIARWSADGKQFDVLDPKGFDELLKVHFEGASPATFHRQLFFYGWVKLNHTNGGGDEKTKGTWSFRHPCFLRDEPSKIYEIKRFARASDREDQDEGSRVDVLERRVAALQSLVDDLSRKLAAVQVTLERAPAAAAVPTAAPSAMSLGRKRVKDERGGDEFEEVDELDETMRLTEDELMQLFDSDDLMMSVEPVPSARPQEPQASPKLKAAAASAGMSEEEAKQHAQQQQAQHLLSTLMSTPQFQAAITSKTLEQQSAPQMATKVQALPHLSVC